MSQEYHSRQNHSAGHPRSSSGGKRVAPSNRHGEEGERRPPARRRRRRRLGVLGALLYVVVVLGVSALLASLGWTWANDLLALNKPEHTATITLPEDIFTTEEIEVESTAEDGTTVTETETATVADIGYVADILEENGLIEYKMIFKIFAGLSHAKYDLAPGTYELNTEMDYRALIVSMGQRSSNRVTTTVTITEGMRLSQIFELLEERGVSTVEKLNDTAANYDFNYSFLKGVIPLGEPNRLEGYLFPDTYEFYMGEEPVSVINKMILRFDEIYTEEMRQDTTEKGMTIQEIVILASMIEKETDGEDQTHIASVLYNRLNNPAEGGTYGYLNIDATILYATGGTQVDISADTPYNTYTHTGLPPTAISNPGSVALRAALYPDSTNDYYYALGDDGVHHFFRTYDQQQAFIATQERYQNG